MKIITTLVATFLMLVGCSGAVVQGEIPPPPEDPEMTASDAVAVADGFLLDDEALELLKKKAENGEKEAAFRISMHYMANGNRVEYERWLRLAADLGHEVAQYNIWFENSQVQDCKVMHESLGWLEKSAANGFQLAVNQIENYRRLVLSCGSK